MKKEVLKILIARFDAQTIQTKEAENKIVQYFQDFIFLYFIRFDKKIHKVRIIPDYIS